MTSPESQVALANLDAIARGRVLVIGFGPELPEAIPDAAVFHQDFRAHRATPGSSFGPWLSEGTFDTAAVELPKATGRLRLLLAMARGLLAPDGRVVVIGHNDLGIRSVGPHLAQAIGPPEVIDYRYHCRALAASLEHEPVPSSLEEWRTEFDVAVAEREFRVRSYPGVFAHGRVDEGTRLLLETIDVPEGARALDVGSGAGVIGVWLRAGGVSVDCVDIDALAVAATGETLARVEGPLARAFGSDLYSGVGGRYTHIVANVPFHAGVSRTLGIAIPLIRDARDHLVPSGELWAVANRQLDLRAPFAETFTHVDIPRQDGRFRVWRARSPRLDPGSI